MILMGNNFENRLIFDKLKACQKWCQFFVPPCISRFVLCEQFRKLVCQYLATLLCVRCGCCKSVGGNGENETEIDAPERDSPPISAIKRRSAAESDTDRPVVSEIEHLLADIRDLLKISARTSARQRQEEEKNQKMMSDWMVAAAVIDRICFILIALFFIAGTAAFIVLRFLPHNPVQRIQGLLS